MAVNKSRPRDSYMTDGSERNNAVFTLQDTNNQHKPATNALNAGQHRSFDLAPETEAGAGASSQNNRRSQRDVPGQNNLAVQDTTPDILLDYKRRIPSRILWSLVLCILIVVIVVPVVKAVQNK